MRLTATLEPLAGLAAIVGAYLATSLAWPPVLTAALVLAYLAQRRNHAPWLSHLQTLRLRPGDVLVASIPAGLRRADWDGAEAKMKREFPGVQVVVIPDTMELAKIEFPNVKQ